MLLVRTTKEGQLQLEAVEPLEVDIAAIHHVERSGFGLDQIEHIHVVYFAIGDVNESGDVAAQIKQSVHFDGGFVAAKTRPRKQAQA